VTARAGRARYDWIMMAFAGVGVVITLVGVIRDFVVG
jgi:hypothetical protein